MKNTNNVLPPSVTINLDEIRLKIVLIAQYDENEVLI